MNGLLALALVSADIDITFQPPAKTIQAGLSSELAKAAFAPDKPNIQSVNGCVTVVLEYSDPYAAKTYSFAAEGLGEVQAVRDRFVRLVVPVGNIPALAGLPGVTFVRLPYRPLEEVESEGVGVIGADNWHTNGQTGAGVTVACIDAGFTGYLSLLGTELPASVNTLSYSGSVGSGTVHGTAVAEVVFDMAPGADLWLVKVADDIDLDQAVDSMLAEGVRLFTCSLGFLGIGSYKGESFLAKAIERVQDSGGLWFNSCGNYAYCHHEDYWTDNDADGWYNFTPVDETLEMSESSGSWIPIYFTWDQWPAANTDFDVYILDSALNVIDSSINRQTGSQPPQELFYWQAPYTGTFHVALYRYSSDTLSPWIELYSRNHGFDEHNVDSSSMNENSTSLGAHPVGAAYWWDDSITYYSSRGPTNDGRLVPNFAGPTSVSNVSYGTFGGTSAAAPHGAGTAALVWGRWPAYTPLEVIAYMETNALDLGPAGPDIYYGDGRLSLPPMVDVKERIAEKPAAKLTVTTLQRGRLKVSFKLPPNTPYTIRVYSVDGRLVADVGAGLDGGDDEILVPVQLPAGFYIVGMDTPDGTVTAPVILTR